MRLSQPSRDEGYRQYIFDNILPQLLSQRVFWTFSVRDAIIMHSLYQRRRPRSNPQEFSSDVQLSIQDVSPRGKQESDSDAYMLLPDSEQEFKIPDFPRAVGFLDGWNKVTQSFWPLAFLGMFSYDLYQYVQSPHNRYQVTLPDLTWGIPQNYNYQYASLSINLGGDIPVWLNYWFFALIFGTSFLAGSISYILGRKSFTQWLRKYEGNFFAKLKALFYIEFSSLFFSSWRKLDRFTSQRNKRRNIFINMNAIRLLTDIAYYCESPAVREAALNHLRELSFFGECKANPLTYFYANYALWQIGQCRNNAFHLFAYLVITPLRLFAQIRLWSLLGNKLLNWIQFLVQQAECDADNKFWRYFPERGGHDCSVCDWDFVDYRSALSGQGCLNALLATARNSSEILKGLKALKNHGPFSQVDFSHQLWPTWPPTEWQEIMNLLQNPAFNSVTLFNLTRLVKDDEAVSPSLLAAVANYLQYAPSIQFLDLTQVTLSVQGLSALLPGLTNNRQIQSLNLTSTALSDDIASQLLAILPSILNLKTLMINDNLLTGWSLHSLGEVLNNTSVINLNVANNFFNTTDLEEFSQILPVLSLQQLDLSYIDFSAVNMSQFGMGLMNSRLRGLHMRGCELADSAAADLFLNVIHSPVTQLNWAENLLGYFSIKVITDELVFGQITDLILDNNLIDDNAVSLFEGLLASPDSPLKTLSLSGNIFTATGFRALTHGLTNSTLLRALRVSHTPIGDAGVSALAAVDNRLIQSLDLSYTGITPDGASELFYYVAYSGLTALDMSGNNIGLAAGAPLQTAWSHSPLERLDISKGQITASTLREALPALPNSRLQWLDLSYNPQDDSMAIDLAELFASPVMNQDRWLTTTTEDIDFNRALTAATPNTALSYLAMNYVGLSIAGIHALCLRLPYTNISNENLLLSGNLDLSEPSGVSGCPAPAFLNLAVASSASIVTPNMGLIIIATFTLLILFNSESHLDFSGMIDALMQIVLESLAAAKKLLAPVDRFAGLGRGIFSRDNPLPLKRSTTGSKRHEVLSIPSDCRQR